MKRMVLLANPQAGREQRLWIASKRLVAKLEKQKISYQIYQRIEDIPDNALDKSVDRLIVLGGDGTLNFAVRFLYKHKIDIPIGIIPVGSGNIFAQALGIPFRINKAIKAALHGHPRTVPVGLVNKKHIFLVGIATGVHASLMEKTPRWSKRKMGIFAYYLRLPFHLFQIKLHHYTLTFPDNKQIQTKASAIYILNGFQGIRREPFQNMIVFKKKLYVLILEIANSRQFARVLTSIFIRGKIPANGVHYLETKSVTLETADAPLRVDGEKISDKKLAITIASKTFQFFLPK